MKTALVNALTLSRVPLSLLFCAVVLSAARPLWPGVALFTAVALSDYLDGKLARRCGVQTRAGAVLDVAVDFFFIVSAGASLFWRGFFPGWMLAVVALKFLEFWFTSTLFNRGRKGAAVFLYDPLGRAAAVLFYLLPAGALLFYACPPAGSYRPALDAACAGVAALAAVSSVFRAASLLRVGKKAAG